MSAFRAVHTFQVFRPYVVPGGRVVPDPEVRPRTGTWRDGFAPAADLSRCVNCLLCWAYCPDGAVRVENAVFQGIDLDRCKGCAVCTAVCPTGALAMVPETPATEEVREPWG
jgi:2-oxoacid:acceptor oxidoreductase delta subunit (pyruvate/2-ketoisovalerate family)